MSIITSSKSGFYISHEEYIKEIYKDVNNPPSSYRANSNLFNIQNPFKTPKGKKKKCCKAVLLENKEVCLVQELYDRFCAENYDFIQNLGHPDSETNKEAIETANQVYSESGLQPLSNLIGSNNGIAVSRVLNNSTYLFPEKCEFYCKDVKEMSLHFKENQKFDLIVLDPPWWNKYIRRKRKHSDGYDMMFNEDLKNIPLENHLKPNGLVVIWCTNAASHLDELIQNILPKWRLKFITKWYWLKVTKYLIPVGPFGPSGGKQPFEQIIFAAREDRTDFVRDQIIMSVPSAIHSHKPPLIKLLEPYLAEDPKCLEVFARCLVPNWTSYGLEVLRLQHESLYAPAD